MTIPILLDEFMKEHNLNLLQFSKYFHEQMEIKVRHNTIGYWAQGRYNPSVKILKSAIRTYPIDDPRGLLARQMACAIDWPELAGDMEPAEA